MIKADVFTVDYTASVQLVNVSLRVKRAVLNASQCDWVSIQAWRAHGNTVASGPISVLIESSAARLAPSGVVIFDGVLILWTLNNTLPGVQICKTIITVVVFGTGVNAHVDSVVSKSVIGEGTVGVACLVLDVTIKSVGTFGDTSIVRKISKEIRRTELYTCSINSLSSWHKSILIHGRRTFSNTLL